MLQLLRDVRHRYSNRVHLLIFFDCLVVLDIIRKWGRSDFHPSPKEVVHFAVIYPLLQEFKMLRRWIGKVTLVEIKSHTGCLLIERADEQAELGLQVETVLAPKSMVLSGCESDLQCENTLKNVPNPSRETVLLIAVCSMLWWLSTLCVPSRNAALCLLQTFYTGKKRM